MEFDAKLRNLMKERRLSQEAVAAEVGVSQNLVSNWVRGKSIPDMREVVTLARLLGVPVAYLADDAIEDPAAVSGGPVTEEEMHIIRFVRRTGLDWAAAIVGMSEEVRRRNEQGGETARILLQSPLSPAELDRIRREIEKVDGPGGGRATGEGDAPAGPGRRKRKN